MRAFFLILILAVLSSCSGNLEKKQTELDEIYGECDNPIRNLSTRKYKECVAKERGGGENFVDLTNSFKDAFNRGGTQTVYMTAINNDLWNAALNVTKDYPLKIADSQGGIIETQWISNHKNTNLRCLIRVRILSTELVSNGVNSKFICEEKNNDEWFQTQEDYTKEEKQITLKILSTASKISNSKI